MDVNRQILLMRDPVDNIVSWFTLLQIRSHSLEIKNNMKEEFPDIWARQVRKHAKIWQEWLDISLRTNCKHLPTYYVRYEDLILEPERVVSEIMCLVLDVPDISGTVCELLV